MIDNFNKEACLDIYRKLRISRRLEEKTNELGNQGKILGSIHTGIGMEAIHVGVALSLKEGDIALRTHRDHGQMIAEGIHPKYIFAELMGKVGGWNKGMGGAMHLAGISGVLGVNVPMAAGAALAFKLRKEPKVVIGQYGDGSANLGPLHEAMNMAAIWNLSAVFVCENNHYAVSTPSSYSTKLKNLSERSAAYGIPGVTADGMDVMDVYKTVSKYVEKARNGEGPAIVECKTYRYDDHSKSTAAQKLNYRTSEEVEEWKKKDPVVNWASRLINEKVCTADDIKKIDELVEKTLEESIELADKSPFPEVEDAFKYMYATPHEGIPQKGW